MKKCMKLIFIFLALYALLAPVAVFADVGPKPSLKIFVKNYISKDYYLDVLVQNEDYNALNRKYPEEYKNVELYKYNKDGWVAKNIRDHLLFGDLKGEYDKKSNMMVHSFSYHGVPQTFKIIIQDTDGSLFVSDVITTNQFNANIILDRETGKVDIVRGDYVWFMGNIPALALTVFMSLALTVFIELLIAIPFKIRPFWVIVWVNIITQILLHSELLSLFYLKAYDIINSAFIATEVLILVVEYSLYKKHTLKVGRRKLLSYVVVANLTTFLLGLIIQI